MMEFIYNNFILIANIASIVALSIAILVLFLTHKTSLAKKVCLDLVVEAEKRYGAGTGEIKYLYVTSLIYPKLPIILKILISEKTLSKWIDEAVEYLQKELSTN